MKIHGELNSTMWETPVFYETLAAASNLTRPEAKQAYDDIADLTDLHRVEVFLEERAA